ncbi:NAD kinase [Geodia barretti]|uniref:NAD kinase n=1 Tax=Geodia barretti TaxID=519541 RepID=A0AA35WMI7_GEOBA|nr:NAD kinase [Geodia barretti]
MEQPKTRTRTQKLLSFHNQRSQIDLDVKGLYGPRAQLVENLHRFQRSTLPPLEDPSCDHHLYWTSPPQTVLVVKKFRDLEVTEKFKTIIAFLVKTLELKVVVELTVLSEKLIEEDSDFPLKELQTWGPE